ncbi:MAG: molecular chaperone HtpG [Bacteroidales bacterium]|jgi:molecular chaperone HtpG|nr:molecular chaperone HtpG [Bacteroidales bacterium]
MQTGKIGVTTENIFPIIKKFLYSDQEIFLRELVSNAVDATQKLKTLAKLGTYKGNVENAVVRVAVNKDAKTITISDQGIGMTAEEIEKYINQIAFSGAEEFLDKYKDNVDAIIGHFGLGFYSSFMVAQKVEIITKSHQEGAQAVKWECDGSPDYSISEIEKQDVGTDIVLHIADDSLEYLDESRIETLLTKYCKFLAVPIVFGKKKEWKDGKYEDTDTDNIINNPTPAWTKKPVDLTDEDYKNFYRELYPMAEEPLFFIHLNVDYPFNLTGILYFPKIRNNFEVQKNKIQLYSNQVFVTDSVEGIVPDYLTLLHGVLDSPDIPLNVSRSYLQSDQNVKKISNHITKKVADRLFDIFKSNREDFEKKWDDLKLFITYGMLSDEKFYERSEKFALFKNTDGKYFTFDEYKTLIQESQTDKNGTLVYLYTTDPQAQYSYIQKAKNKGYDVLVLDGHLDAHLIGQLEQKFEKTHFARVDSDIIEKIILKEDLEQSNLSAADVQDLTTIFETEGQQAQFTVQCEKLSATEMPIVITQSEFMRRMKDMAHLNPGMSFYSQLPDSFNLIVNTAHPIIEKINADKNSELQATLQDLTAKITAAQDEKTAMTKANEGKKDEEIPSADKEKTADLDKTIANLEGEKRSALKQYAGSHAVVKQLIDLALISNNMLKGEDLEKFVHRSVKLIQ